MIFVETKKRGDKMSPRTGRPTNDPKTLSTRIRLSEEDIKRETKGFKYDEELEIWTRKGSNNGYYTLNY